MDRQKALKNTNALELRAFILIAIARLRQAISHPYLLEGVLGNILEPGDFEHLEAQFAEAGDKIPANSRVRKLLKMELGKRMGHGDNFVSAQAAPLKSVIDTDPLGKAVMSNNDIGAIICILCHDAQEEPIFTKVSVYFKGY